MTLLLPKLQGFLQFSGKFAGIFTGGLNVVVPIVSGVFLIQKTQQLQGFVARLFQSEPNILFFSEKEGTFCAFFFLLN